MVHDPSEYRELMMSLGYRGEVPLWAHTDITPPKTMLRERDIELLRNKIETLKQEKKYIIENIVKEIYELKACAAMSKSKMEAERKERHRLITQLKVISAFKDAASKKDETPKPKIDKDIKESLYTSENEFSIDSKASELPANNNVLDILIIEGIFDETKISNISHDSMLKTII